MAAAGAGDAFVLPEVGEPIPPFERATDLAVWNRYAAVNYEFVPIHMDDAAGQAAGYPGAFGMGNLLISYIHNMLRDFFPDDARIRNVACKFRAPNLRGTARAEGVVTSVERCDGDEVVVSLDVSVVNSEGTRMAEGSAAVLLPSGA